MTAKLLFAAPVFGLTCFASLACAEVISVKGGTVSIDVSATQMSRLLVQGEKITAVRSLDDPSGPQLLVQNDPATGDVFVGFDGDTAGRTFSLFVTTDQGETVQVLLHPGDGAARTIELVPEIKATAQTGSASLKVNGYAETVTAFMKLMFNSQVTDGVTYTPVDDEGETTAHLKIRTVGYYRAAGIRGIVLYVTNRDTVPQDLKAEQFLVKHVIAAGVSHEMLKPGDSARVYIAEEAQ